MENKLLIGVSSCVLGQNVRFDGGHKNNQFVSNELADYCEFIPICPEIGAGLPVPRPTIRLVNIDDSIRLVETKAVENDHTDKLVEFSSRKVGELKQQPLCGYVVCAKSPTCGMERVKVYQDNRADKNGVGLFTQQLQAQMPWLPIEEDGRLNDAILKENFISRIYALHDLQQSVGDNPSPGKIVAFHSRYKLTLMAHHPASYRELGKLVANIKHYSIDDFFENYRLRFMQALTVRASRKNNTNTLMHLQGYFKNSLSKEHKAELSRLIEEYRLGLLPLLAPLTLIKHYLSTHPDEYLEQQHYLNPYPQELRLRYGL
ncbi:YbgA family protein [Vibrio sp. RC27]